MNINDAFPSKWLKHTDLKGQAHVLTMSHVQQEEYSDGETGAILYFQNSKKGLGLNVTNKNVLVDLYGPETDGWNGMPIELYPTKTEFRGRMTDCVRLRQPGTNPEAPATGEAMQPVQDDPFEESPPLEGDPFA